MAGDAPVGASPHIEGSNDRSFLQEGELTLVGRDEVVTELLRHPPDFDLRESSGHAHTGVLEPALGKERISEEGVFAVALREEATRRERVVGHVDGQRGDVVAMLVSTLEGSSEMHRKHFAIGIQVTVEGDVAVARQIEVTERMQLEASPGRHGGLANQASDDSEGSGRGGHVHSDLQMR